VRVQTPEPELHARLLGDAEVLAKRGRRREALVLLRWVGRVAPPEAMPLVLLTYQRLRVDVPATRPAPTRTALARERSEDTAGMAGVAADRLGFPVPRFPTRAPSVDPTAFVPRPPATVHPRESPQWAPAEPPARPPRRSNPRRWGILALAAIVAVVALAPGTRRQVEAVIARADDPTGAAEAALRDGDPARALAVSDGSAEPRARLLVIRGRAFLALGDTSAALTAIRAAAAHPLASAPDLRDAGELLESVGQLKAAADAYLRSFSAGLPPEEWPEVVRALERAGRHDQASRLRGMLPPAGRGSIQ
jgi:hypothetical protein